MDKIKFYFSVILKITYNFLKLSCIKLFSGNKLAFYPLQLLSLSTKLRIKGKGKISISGRISSRSGVCIYSSGGGNPNNTFFF